jgi:hypothetical protein
MRKLRHSQILMLKKKKKVRKLSYFHRIGIVA